MPLQKIPPPPGPPIDYNSPFQYQQPPFAGAVHTAGSPPGPAGFAPSPAQGGYFVSGPVSPHGASPPFDQGQARMQGPAPAYIGNPTSPPGHGPQMAYAAQAGPPQNVFLGFVHNYSSSKPVYGPPGANFDSLGNLYMMRVDGSKEWIGPYRNGAGQLTQNPQERMEEDCCYWLFGHKGNYDV